MQAANSNRSSSKRRDPYLGKVIAGRYRIEARLGEGGMGVVYRARHVLIERVVALKLIRPDLKSETHLRAWMLREARAANRVDHAHIVEIHDVGEAEDGELYLVMEYLIGASLASECARGVLPIARAVDIIEQMCAALARAHDLGVIHRDLKSENIMLTVRGGRRDFVKILDFGLAALARDPRLAPKGAVFGTPEYMSPEQARGDDAISLSDLYSLGVLFYEMVTGKLPFRSNDRETLLEMQRSAKPTPPRMLRADLPQAAEDIIMRLLEKDPAKRFRDGHHLQDELKAVQRALPPAHWDIHQSETPIAAPPPPPAPSPGVVEWGTRAAMFGRLLARGYANGGAPPEINEAMNTMWDLAAKASRLEGELASHSQKLDAIERRGRALRAEIGRKVEELAVEESRALRDAASEKKRLPIHNQMDAEQRLKTALKRVEELEHSGAQHDVQALRTVFEELGAAKANLDAVMLMAHDGENRINQRESIARDLRKQIEELRQQLRRYSESLESDLATGRERIAGRVREALNFERKFSEVSAQLLAHLRDRPECHELLEEMAREQSIVVEAPSNTPSGHSSQSNR
ncbi:MAG: protein kinase [Myxococcales bacterium]|nr:MAG: protein kinase [Myxococcales bacterium]